MAVKRITPTQNLTLVSPISNTNQVVQGPKGDPGAINSDITAIVTLTQAEYDALTPSPTTLYIIQ